MADTFYREPINHGDFNNWYNYLMLQTRVGGRGGLSMELLNTGGALHLSAGYAGIDDGITKGTIERTADSALSIAGVSVGTWASIEVSVSGSACTYYVTDIAGANDEGTIPASVKVAYDYFKGGYYLVAIRRLLGIAFKKAAGTLGRIVNCESGKMGFKSIQVVSRLIAGAESLSYIATKIIDIGDWNMDVTATVAVVHGIVQAKIRRYFVIIRYDANVGSDLTFPLDYNPAGIAGYFDASTANQINLGRIAGGAFDSVNFDSVVYNRGWVTIEYET